MGTLRPGRRRLLILAAVAAGFLVATVALLFYGLPYRRHLEVQRQLAAFRTDPSQENASQLARIIASGRADRVEVQEIVRAWLDLKVVEESYRPNAPITVTLTSGNRTALAFGPWVENKDIAPTRQSPEVNIRLCGYSTGLNVPEVAYSWEGVSSRFVKIDPGIGNRVFGEIDSVSSPEGPETLSVAKPGVYPGVVVVQGRVEITYTYAEEEEVVTSYYTSPLPPTVATSGILDRVLHYLGLKEDYDPHRYPCRIEVPIEIRVEDGPEPPGGNK